MEAMTLERTLTELDHMRLSRLIPGAFLPGGEANVIEPILASAQVVPSRAVSPRIVTMYSQVVLAFPDGALKTLIVCYPEDAEPQKGFVSVLSPVGSSLIGLQAGQTARWRTPIGDEGAAKVVRRHRRHGIRAGRAARPWSATARALRN
jgi:regulator of nucleoside diphosphate kinase